MMTDTPYTEEFLNTDVYDVSKIEPGDTFKVTVVDPTFKHTMVFHSTKLSLYVGDCLTYLSKSSVYYEPENVSYEVMMFFLSRGQVVVDMDQDNFEHFATENNVLAPLWYLKKVL